ncbi:Ig-like domain-containing protein [Porticoccaceae bacterium LTM1]|nr:Ig-like domain-containing protein [Porticoccaceae bacterium LTM1]
MKSLWRHTSSTIRRIYSTFMGAVVATGILLATVVLAVDALNLFELDGNAVESGDPGEDWETLYSGGSNDGGTPIAFTGVLDDISPLSIYWQGGSKDINDVSEWNYKDGAVPDKDDITNAYAAAYINGAENGIHLEDDLIIYFGLDRYANKGDAFAGFWFFRDRVGLDGIDAFTGNHMDGDLLVLVEYPQASGAVPEIKVYEWVFNGGDISDHLKLLLTASNAECDGSGGKIACAITNAGDEASPWPYTPKAGSAGTFPFESFYEGGINVSALMRMVGEENSPCFNSFLAETRSSRSETAQLKDFVLGGFPLCQAVIDTEIHAGSNHLTDVQNTTLKVGSSVHDFINIIGSGVPNLPDPTGTADWTLYDNATCDGNVLDSGTANLTPAGGGTATADNVGGYTKNTAGSISYGITYSGDENFPPVDEEHCEVVSFEKYDTMTSTAIHAENDHATDIQGGAVNIGTSVHDQATVALANSESDPGGLPDPTGTITFTRYATSDCTGTGVDEVVSLDNGDGGVEESSAFVTNLAGGLSYSASYSGDSFYNGSSHACEVLTVNKFDSNILTHIHAGADHSTDIQGTTIKVLTSIHDQAIVSGAGPDPTGTVTFRLFSDLECQTTPVVFDSVAIAADGSDDGSAAVESKSMVTSAGVLAFSASYGGDDNYNPSSAADCEPLTVEKYDTMTATAIHQGNDHVTDIQGGAVDIGTSVHDQGTVSLANSESNPGGLPDPTGTLTFTRYATSDCTGTGVDEVVSLDNGDGGVEESSAFVTNLAGGLSYAASYSGDANYNGSSHACEVLTVNKLDSNILTHIHAGSDHSTDIQGTTIKVLTSIHDQAIVSGAGPDPTGTVTFRLFSDLECQTTPVVFDSVAISSDGSNDGSTAVESKSMVTSEGVLAFSASYGGDGYYNPSGAADCEPLTVVKYDTMTATAIHQGNDHVTDIQGGAVDIGTSVHDQGTVSLANSESDPGGLPDPTGTLTFTRYATSDCTGTGVNEVVSLDNGDGGVEESSAFVTNLAGGLSYAASYSGDANYNGSSHACEVLTVNKLDSNILTHIHAGSDHSTDIQGTTIKVLTSIHDQAIVSGAGPDPTGTVTFRLFSDLECQTTPVVFDSVAISSDGSNDGSTAVESKSMVTSEGVLAFSASYGGDGYYNPSGAADCEPLTVVKYDTMTATAIHQGSDHVTDIQGGAVNIGTSVHDQGTVSLANTETDPGGLPDPTGTLTFTRYATSDCTGTGVNEVVSLDNGDGGVEESSAFVTNAAGGLSYAATYSGDANYNGSSHSCEVLTVNKLVSNIRTEVHDPAHIDITGQIIDTDVQVHDTAYVTGAGATPTGTVTFVLFDNLTCDGNLVSQVDVALDGSGVAKTPSFFPGAGEWSYSASYGGDDIYDPSGPAACEPFTVVSGEMGCTPGFWKNSLGSWADTDPLVQPTDPITAWFTLPNGVINNNLGGDTLLDALNYGGGDNLLGAAEILLRAAVASLLNATHVDVDFPWSYMQVINEVNAALATKDRATILALASDLDADNNLGCELPNDSSF